MSVGILMLPVTAGDATLIVDRDGDVIRTAVLVDTGRRKDEVASLLAQHSITKLDLLLISHVDLDHVGGLASVVEQVRVSEIWCLDIYRIRRAIDPAWEGGEREREGEGPRIRIAPFVARLTNIDGALKRSFVRGVPCYHVEEGHSQVFGRLGIEVLWPPKRYVEYVLDPKNLKKLFEERRPPFDWIAEEGERPRDVDRGEAQRRAKRRVEEQQMPRGPQDERTAELELDAGSIWPGESFANNLSIVAKVGVIGDPKSSSALFTGDLEDWSGLIARQGANVRAGIWKVPHHGSPEVGYDLGPLFTMEFTERYYDRLPRPFRYIWHDMYRYMLEYREFLSSSPPLLPWWPCWLFETPWRVPALCGGPAEICSFVHPAVTLVFPFASRGLPNVPGLETGFHWGEVVFPTADARWINL